MYNRYIPQADGSYRRNRIEDPSPSPAPKHYSDEQPNTQASPVPSETPCQRGLSCPHGHSPNCQPSPPRPRKTTPPISAGNFLKQLLPKNFDTEDLLIVLLLLLMAGDCQEDQNTALLTLALYLFL